MAITPKEIVSSVRTRFKLWDSEGYANFPDLLFTHLMNEAQTALLHSLSNDALIERYKTDNQSGAAGSVILATDLVRLISVRINNIPTPIINTDEYRRVAKDAFGGGSSTSPVSWMDNGKLYYSPENMDATVVYKYIPELAAMALPSTSSTLPDSYHYLIELYVLSKTADRLNRGDLAAFYIQTYEKDIQKINAQTAGQAAIRTKKD